MDTELAKRSNFGCMRHSKALIYLGMILFAFVRDILSIPVQHFSALLLQHRSALLLQHLSALCFTDLSQIWTQN